MTYLAGCRHTEGRALFQNFGHDLLKWKGDRCISVNKGCWHLARNPHHHVAIFTYSNCSDPSTFSTTAPSCGAFSHQSKSKHSLCPGRTNGSKSSFAGIYRVAVTNKSEDLEKVAFYLVLVVSTHLLFSLYVHKFGEPTILQTGTKPAFWREALLLFLPFPVCG